MGKIRAILAVPGERLRIGEIGGDLESLQDFVGGYIEHVALEKGGTLICNEDGRLRGLPDNRGIDGVGMIKGPFLICGMSGGELVSAPHAVVKRYAPELAGGPKP